MKDTSELKSALTKKLTLQEILLNARELSEHVESLREQAALSVRMMSKVVDSIEEDSLNISKKMAFYEEFQPYCASILLVLHEAIKTYRRGFTDFNHPSPKELEEVKSLIAKTYGILSVAYPTSK